MYTSLLGHGLGSLTTPGFTVAVFGTRIRTWWSFSVFRERWWSVECWEEEEEECLFSLPLLVLPNAFKQIFLVANLTHLVSIPSCSLLPRFKEFASVCFPPGGPFSWCFKASSSSIIIGFLQTPFLLRRCRISFHKLCAGEQRGISLTTFLPSTPLPSSSSSSTQSILSRESLLLDQELESRRGGGGLYIVQEAVARPP